MKTSRLKALEVRVMQLDVTEQESVDRLARDLGDQRIDRLTTADSGTFWTHDGEQMPW